jgi:hypothetical protein
MNMFSTKFKSTHSNQKVLNSSKRVESNSSRHQFSEGRVGSPMSPKQFSPERTIKSYREIQDIAITPKMRNDSQEPSRIYRDDLVYISKYQ